jgi:hypothetical protein
LRHGHNLCTRSNDGGEGALKVCFADTRNTHENRAL